GVGQLGATGSRHGGWVSMLLDEWIRKGNCKSHSRYARSSAMRSWIMDQMCQRRTTTIRKSLATVVLFGVASLAQAQSAPGAAPTFAKDVAPIFQQKCQTCHRPGQMGPMSLLTYQDARPWARAIKTKVAARDMPP